MKLPSLPFLKKTVPKEYYLALLLQDALLRAVVFEESNGSIHIVGEGKSTLPTQLDTIPFEHLLNAADKAISVAENILPPNVQSHKTIFGVKESWTENLQISKDHLITLKKLCDELDLQPIGFLVFAEAIAHLLQKNEGAPVSAVLVELGTKTINATLLRAGRVIASRQSPVSESLPKAVDELLAHFTDVEILPSRIILLDSQKRAHLSQQFTNHSWSKHLPFLHVPQITNLPEGFETQAILFGTATQMGFAVADVTMPRSRVKNSLPAMPEVAAEEMPEENEAETGPEEEQLSAEGEIPEQVQTEEPAEAAEKEHPQQESHDDTDAFGFVKDKDVLESTPGKPIVYDNFRTTDDESAEEYADEAFADIPEEVKEEEERSTLPGMGANAVMITEGMQKVFGRLKKVPFASYLAPLKNIPTMFEGAASGTNASKRLIFIAPVILILLVGSILWYIFGIKATATLFIDPKNVTASQGITFSSTDGTDISSDTIGGTVTPITETGSTTTQATGSQDVGDKAKGTVTIYNNDDTSHTISAGTTLTSANGLKFVTSKDVTVASASGDIFSGTKPGTQSVDVTAADIGTEYNLPSGTKFAIGNSTIIAAKNDSAFSGGTKKTVTVVSQKDLDKLTSDLTSNLGQKAKQDAQNNNNAGKVVLSTFLSTDMSNQKFDHKAGDQTDSVTLAATITYQALSYDKADLDKVALAIIQSNNAQENISAENISEDLQNPTVSKDSKSINATLQIKAGLLPKVDTIKIAQELAGKSFSQATSALSDVPQLVSVQGVLHPNLFFLPKSFPRFASHITVGIKANE